jgi:hypothetical protein
VPFYIVGAGRSGSTYLYYLLKAHPRIAITNEARVSDSLGLAAEVITLPYGKVSQTRGFMGVIHPDAIDTFKTIFCEHAIRMFEEYYERTFDYDFTHYGDKLADPFTVAWHAGLVPEVRIIMMVRDPRDVVCSYLSLKRMPHDLGPRFEEMKGSSVSDLDRVWRDTYVPFEALRSRVHRVDYVELVENPRRTVAAVLDYLGLPLDPAVELAIKRNDTIGGHGTSTSARASIDRWHRELSPGDATVVIRVCGDMMSRIGLPI